MLEGFTNEFIRSGHEADDLDCKRCLPDYPRRCACGGLVHAQASVAGGEGFHLVYCCDRCGPDYNEDTELDREMDEEREENLVRT